MSLFDSTSSRPRLIFAASIFCLLLDFLLPDLAAAFSRLHPALYAGLRVLLLFWAVDLFFWILFEKKSAAALQKPVGFHLFPLLPRLSFCMLIVLLSLTAAIGWQHVLAPVLHLPQGQSGFCQGSCGSLFSHFGL